MNTPKLSIYCYAFGARRAKLDLDVAVLNMVAFADEVVIATLADQEDDTLDRLLRWEDALNTFGTRLKVVVVDTDICANNRFDGDLKTAALQACTHPVRIIADCDERFLASQRPRWDDLALQLLANPQLDGWLIPVVDLYGSTTTIRADRPIGLKLRMHKATIVRRGVPAAAERGGGLFDTSQSDSTEPQRADGRLGSWMYACSPTLLSPQLASLLDVYVVHLGFLDLAARAELGRTFWKHHWEARSGKPEQVATTVAELTDGVPLISHNLPVV